MIYHYSFFLLDFVHAVPRVDIIAQCGLLRYATFTFARQEYVADYIYNRSYCKRKGKTVNLANLTERVLRVPDTRG